MSGSSQPAQLQVGVKSAANTAKAITDSNQRRCSMWEAAAGDTNPKLFMVSPPPVSGTEGLCVSSLRSQGENPLVQCIINIFTYYRLFPMIHCVSRRAPAVILSAEERATLQSWAGARSRPQRLVQRAQIILMAAEEMENQEIAGRLSISRPTVQLWRQRFLA